VFVLSLRNWLDQATPAITGYSNYGPPEKLRMEHAATKY
jgi:hypothetical protein